MYYTALQQAHQQAADARADHRENGVDEVPTKDILSAQGIDSKLVYKLAGELDAILDIAMPTAQRTCTFTNPSVDGKRFTPRKVCRKYRNLLGKTTCIPQP